MSVTLLVLTYNEERHIKRCLDSVRDLVEEMIVVDSYSSDKTVEIAKAAGARVLQNQWPGSQSLQLNWALPRMAQASKWILRLDADEYLLPELSLELQRKIPLLDDQITGIYLKRRVYFMDKWIRHGGYYPVKILRLWRPDAGIMEDKWMDEHLELKYGKSVLMENDFVDENLNDLTWWIDKHNKYATREAVELLNLQHGFLSGDGFKGKLSGEQEKRKRWLKNFFYNEIPLFVRPFIYFLYRYFLRLGFMDGVKGLIWHFLQGFWYRFLVDTKVYDVKRRALKESRSVKAILEDYLGHPL